MRVPLFWVIPLVLVLMGAVWWNGTRHMDFMTPPSESELAAIREKVETSLPKPPALADAISVPSTSAKPVEPVVMEPEPPPPPRVELGDRSTIPGLSAYQEVTPKGASHLIEMAYLLESEGDFQRALLAWERVLDSTTADANQTASAITAVKRLRPTLPDWNIDSEAAIPILLHSGTGKAFAATLKPVLESVARELERASSGILKVTPELDTGAGNVSVDQAAPVAVWLGSPGKKAPVTEVASFTAGKAETLRTELLQTAFKLIRLQLEATKTIVPPPPLSSGEDPREALEFRITRRSWEALGTALNPAPPPAR